MFEIDYLFSRNLNGDFFCNNESNQMIFKSKSTLKYAQMNCQDCRCVHILRSQSWSMFLFFLQ